MKSKSDHSSDNKVKSFRENILVIKEEWFSDMYLINGATFTMALIKRAKSRINQNYIFSCDTKQYIRETEIINYCST